MNDDEVKDLLEKFVEHPDAMREWIDAWLIAMLEEKLRPYIEEEERRIIYGDGSPANGLLPNRGPLPKNWQKKKRKPKKKRGKKRK